MTYSQEDISTQWYMIRVQRDYRLSLSDWIGLSDCQLNADKKNEWIIYRQALRDITSQEDPFNIIWPNKPT